ncbi:MAG: AMP-binding protein [Proteobacteria bacterium]|nr:AMP-binding protein [Pseudomonadota bacterium]
MNIASHMIRAGRAFRDNPAVAKGTTIVCDYATVASRVAHIAWALRHQYDLELGDRVALVSKNRPEYLELLYAIWHAGLVAVPVNAKLHRNEFKYILDNSQAKLCFTTQSLTEDIASTGCDALQSIVEIGDATYTNMLTGATMPLAPRAADDLAWLFYTSGTTGMPKGAMLSHRNLLAMSLCYFADVDQSSPWRTILHAAPMSHGSGLYALAYVMQGGCHVVPESSGFDVAEIYALIRHWPGSAFFAAPTMVKRLVDHPADEDTTNLKAIIYGGGPMYVEDCLAGLDRFGPKLTQLYGQGESPMTITALSARMHADRDHPRWLERLASVGIAQSVVDVRIRSTGGDWLPEGEIGEVLVKGETVMKGYWQNPVATDETLRDGWLHTGDFGVLDMDGFLTLKDRSKDLIISGGSNIYPREIEEVLLKHPDIVEVSVIGRPDREWGESVVAYVVMKDGTSLDTASLDEFCLASIARFKRPREYRLIDALPRNSYGKVLKTKLRELDGNR